MANNIVHIESANKENKSFGTGFVIESNSQGSYVLTCQHVLDSVQDARIESQTVEVIASNSFLDMAIIFLPAVHYEKMFLQLDPCHNLNISSIAFSSFKKDLVQKSTIRATLFEDFIELHSTEDDAFYLIKKIKANEHYSFSKGNSGAPIICDKTSNVIAMLSNKEGTNIAYAIGVSSIKKLLEQLYNEQTLMQKHKNFYLKFSSFKSEVSASIQTRQNPNNKSIFDINELKEEKNTLIKLFNSKRLKFKYFFLGVLFMFALYGAYSFFSPKSVDIHQYYQVNNIPEHETLNVREGAGRGYRVLNELMPNTTQIIVTRCKHNDEGTKWCRIKYRNIEGWVHSYYLKKETNNNSH